MTRSLHTGVTFNIYLVFPSSVIEELISKLNCNYVKTGLSLSFVKVSRLCGSGLAVPQVPINWQKKLGLSVVMKDQRRTDGARGQTITYGRLGFGALKFTEVSKEPDASHRVCLEGGCNNFPHDVGTFLPAYTASRHVILPNLRTPDLLRYYLSLYFCLSTFLPADPFFCVRPHSVR